jgi:outer membrane protein OmpA-like peptidoglycan-associated protein
MLGEVIQSKSSGKSNGTSLLEIRFDSLQHQTTNVPVTATVDSVSNSKGQASVDDQNLSLQASSKTPASPSGHHFGSAFGGLVSKAANISSEVGDAAGGAAGPASTITLTARGPQIELGAGSQLAISVKSHGGPELASLPANAPAAAPATAASSGASSSASAANANSLASGSSAPAAATDANGQPILTATKIDFVPGEKTVFYDDFSDMATDEPPPHWKVRGDGPVELRTGGGIRELTITKNTDMYSSKFAIPSNFTAEVQAVAYKGSSNNVLYFLDPTGSYKAQVYFNVRPGNLELSASDAHEDIGHATAPITYGKPFTVAFWAQQGRVRVYVDGNRAIDANQTQIPALASLRLHSDFYGDSGPIGIRSVRVAESAPDFSQVLASTGKYVTHGIYFDTDSDRLKPESAAVIKQAANALEKNPNLKLEIDGDTDSTGNPQHNKELSQKRAEAVRSVLIAQFGVDASRLTAAGFGADKPIASNDTPEGRAQNRRVEFVKR